MNPLQKTIIKALSKSSSKQPMPFDDLLKKCGASQDALQTELHAMYQVHIINQCQLTKFGVTQMVYWPTAIIDKPINYHTLHKTLDKTLSPAPRRAENEKLTTNTAKEQNIMPDVANEPNKPTSLRLLEHIEKHPDCAYSDFTDKLKIDGASAFLGNHIKRGNVIKTQVGPRKYNYSLVAGKTAAEIYNNGAKKQPQTQNNKTQNQAAETREALIFNMVANKKENLDMKAIETDQPKIVTIKALEDKFESPNFSIQKPEFKVAFTSNSTLMLFGVEYMPIELSQENTATLMEYIELINN